MPTWSAASEDCRKGQAAAPGSGAGAGTALLSATCLRSSESVLLASRWPISGSCALGAGAKADAGPGADSAAAGCCAAGMGAGAGAESVLCCSSMTGAGAGAESAVGGRCSRTGGSI
jgi:hypothetical protein